MVLCQDQRAALQGRYPAWEVVQRYVVGHEKHDLEQVIDTHTHARLSPPASLSAISPFLLTSACPVSPLPHGPVDSHWSLRRRPPGERGVHGLLVGQARTALHDIWVLSLVDDAVLTPRSTFGYHAMALKVPCPCPCPRPWP
jgi:hypothetical protein